MNVHEPRSNCAGFVIKRGRTVIISSGSEANSMVERLLDGGLLVTRYSRAR